MPILFRANGKDYQNFKAITLKKSLVQFCGAYNLLFTDRKDTGSPFKGDEDIEIVVEGESVFTGYISTFNGEVTGSSHMLKITGKEKTVDVAQSTLTENIEFLNSVKIEDVIKKVLESLGLEDISVSSTVEIDPFKEEEIVSGKMGENAYAFIEKYARKRQCLITTDRNGDILIQRSTTVDEGDVLQLIQGNPTNNVLRSGFKEDFDNSFYQYTCKCADNLSLGNLNTDFENRVAYSYNEGIRKTRKLEIIMDSSSIDTLKKRAIWEKNVRLNGGEYKAIVKGHLRKNGKVWDTNILVDVKDTTWGIEKKMIVKDVVLTQDDTGNTTELVCVDPIAFSTVDDYEYNFQTGSLVRL